MLLRRAIALNEYTLTQRASEGKLSIEWGNGGKFEIKADGAYLGASCILFKRVYITSLHHRGGCYVKERKRLRVLVLHQPCSVTQLLRRKKERS